MANAAFVRSRSGNNFGVQADRSSAYALPTTEFLATKKISRKQRFASARTKSDASIRRKPRLKAQRRARLRRLKRGER
jgi:hypothetical protein